MRSHPDSRAARGVALAGIRRSSSVAVDIVTLAVIRDSVLTLLPYRQAAQERLVELADTLLAAPRR